MTTYTVRVKPGASRTSVGGCHGDPPALVVAVTEPAVDGRATEAVLRAVAKALGLRRGRVELVSGQAARTKVVRIIDPPAELDDRWADLLAGGS